jgi:hypothetical protein
MEKETDLKEAYEYAFRTVKKGKQKSWGAVRSGGKKPATTNHRLYRRRGVRGACSPPWLLGPEKGSFAEAALLLNEEFFYVMMR